MVDLTPTAALHLAVDANPLWLVSPWKAVLLMLPFLGWAWIVSTVYDKDAKRFYLGQKTWNIVHMVFALLALAVAFLVPIFWIGLPAATAVLAIDLAVYYIKRNADDRVPAPAKWNLSDILSPKKKGAGDDKKLAKRMQGVTLKIIGPAGAIPAPEKETPEFEVRAAAEDLVVQPLDNRGSRFEIVQASSDAFAYSYVVDGVRTKPEPIPAQKAIAMIDFWKAAAGMDVQDRRKKQTKEITVEHVGVPRKLKLITLGGSSGLRLTGVIDATKQVARKPEELGLLDVQQQAFDALVGEHKGVVLLAAPSGQGRTSTMYAFVKAHDAYTLNVQTLELELEATVEGVRQNIFDPTVDGAEFSTTARSILRRDPEVFACAEADANTCKEIAKADHPRTRCYLSLKANGALQAAQMYLKAVGDTQQAGESLYGAVAQRLVRRLCPNCKAPFQPSPDVLKKLGLPTSVKQLHRKGGQVLVKDKPEICPMCQGGGYVGQEAVFEIFPIDAEMRSMLAKGDFASFKAALRSKRYPTMQEAAMRKVVDGVTSIDEVVRVLSDQQQGASSQGAAQRQPA